MKPKLYLFIFILGQFLYAQSYEFNYSYSFKKDSLSKRFYNDVMSVFLEGNKRIYRSKNLIVQDSIFYSNQKKYSSSDDLQFVMNIANEYPYYTENYQLELDLVNENSLLKLKGFGEIPNFMLERKLVLPNWELTNENTNYNGKSYKIAKSNFIGRNWIAVYDENIPFSIAPYMFYGLPGLIVKLEDENNNFRFELVDFKSRNDLSNFYNTNYFFNKIEIIEPMSLNTIVELGIKAKENEILTLMNFGVQYSEDQIKKIENSQKKKKYIFLDPNIPFVL